MNIDKEPSIVIEVDIFHPDGPTVPQELMASLAIDKTLDTTAGSGECPTTDISEKIKQTRRHIERYRQDIESQRTKGHKQT